MKEFFIEEALEHYGHINKVKELLEHEEVIEAHGSNVFRGQDLFLSHEILEINGIDRGEELLPEAYPDLTEINLPTDIIYPMELSKLNITPWGQLSLRFQRVWLDIYEPIISEDSPYNRFHLNILMDGYLDEMTFDKYNQHLGIEALKELGYQLDTLSGIDSDKCYDSIVKEFDIKTNDGFERRKLGPCELVYWVQFTDNSEPLRFKVVGTSATRRISSYRKVPKTLEELQELLTEYDVEVGRFD